MRIHNPSITGSLSISGSGLSIDGIGTFSGSSTSTGSFGSIVTNTRDVFRYGVQAISNDAQDNPAVDGRGGGILIENLNSAGSAMLRMRGGDGFATLGGITLVMYSIPGMLAVAGAFMINYFSRFFKYSSTLCIPGGYLILVFYTKNVNSQMIGMGILYSMVFLKSNSSVFKDKLKSLT